MILSSITCPIPSAIHPDADRVDARSIEWMKRFSLSANDAERLRMAHAGCGRLAARLAPAASRDRLQIISDFFIWNFSLDDEYCDEGPLSRQPGPLARALSLIQRAAEIPECAPCTDDRYALALHDIRCRLDAHASPKQVRLWLEMIRSWFLAEVWKAGNVAAQRMPDIDEYVTWRLYGGGGLAFPVLISIAEGYAVPDPILEDRRVRAMTEMAVSLATWISDIASYEKEMEREQGAHNLVSAIQHTRHCSLEQAASHALALYQQVMQLFLRLRSDLAQNASTQLCRYTEGLGHFVRASLDWSHATERYSKTAGMNLTLEQERTSQEQAFSAASIPSIAWWWRYDPARLSEGSTELEQSASG